MERYRQIVLETVDKILDNLDADFRAQIVGFHEENLLLPWQSPYGMRKLDEAGKRGQGVHAPPECELRWRDSDLSRAARGVSLRC
jgi:protoheme ferro-lyase